MKSGMKLWAVAPALLVFAAASMAKPPTETGCAVLLPAAINAGQSYSVKVVRVPSYPGGWVSPTFNIDVSYPTTPGNVIGDSREQTILRYNVTYTVANFTAPEEFDQQTGEQVIVSGGTAYVTATVKEPINKKKFKETNCAATVTVY